MPSLKDINCSIEVGPSQQKLQEYGTTYGDGCVETFVMIPVEPVRFGVRLTSDTYIAHGLAMFVFINGVYQCNRNRRGLLNAPGNSSTLDGRTVFNLIARQKEQKTNSGDLLAEEWRFDKLNIGKRTTHCCLA
jgi:hypothetical protein